MALDDDQRQTVLNHLQQNVQGGCPACGGEMGVHDQVLLPPLLEDGNMQVGSGLPSVVAVCRSCGNVQFFAAEVVGVDPQNV